MTTHPTPVTGESVSDEQLKALAAEASELLALVSNARGYKYIGVLSTERLPPGVRDEARARCAALINARNAKATHD